MTTTTTSTSRLDDIATRQRRGHTRDIAFAMMIAVFLILSGFALRDAGAMPLSRATRPAPQNTTSAAYVAYDAHGALCTPTVC